MIGGIAETFVVYIFYWIITDQTPSTNGQSFFFADFYIWLNAGTLAFLLIGTNKIVDRVGLGIAVLCLPVALVPSARARWLKMKK